MKLNSLPYLICQGFRNLWINRLMSLASIAVLSACLLLVGFAILFTINVNNVVKFVETQNEAVVFVKDYSTQIQIENLGNMLKNHNNISNIEYISKQRALEIEIERLGEDGVLLEGLEKDNPLPASFNIKIKDISILRQTVEEIISFDAVEKVNAPTEVTDTIVIIKDLVNSVGGSIVLALVIVSLVIISNTIRASVFFRRKEINIMKYVGATNSFIKLPFIIEGIILGLISSIFASNTIRASVFFRRKEINIMKYVGATNSFIKLPFIIEGIILGLISSIFALLITWLGYNALFSFSLSETTNWLSSVFSNMVHIDKVIGSITVSYCVSGIIVGALGSLFSIRNHLKV